MNENNPSFRKSSDESYSPRKVGRSQWGAVKVAFEDLRQLIAALGLSCRKAVLFGIALALILGAVEQLGPIAIRLASRGNNRLFEDPSNLGWIVFFLGAFADLLRYGLNTHMARTVAHNASLLYRKALASILQLPSESQKIHSPAAWSFTLDRATRGTAELMKLAVELLSPVGALVSVLALGFIDKAVFVIVGATPVAITLLTALQVRSQRGRFSAMEDKRRDVSGQTAQVLLASREVKFAHIEGSVATYLGGQVTNVYEAERRHVVSMSRFELLKQLSERGGFAGVLYFGVVSQIGSGQAPSAASVAVLVLFNNLIQPFKMLNKTLDMALERIHHMKILLKTVSAPEVIRERSVFDFRSPIEFKNVSFRYADAKNPVLNKVSFVIPANKVTAIVGRSGTGKSTIGDLVCGIIVPNNGHVFVGSRQVQPIEKENSPAALLPQFPVFLPGTIRENLSARADAVEDSEIWEALRLAKIDQAVTRWGGLDAMMTNNAMGLSGGEKQRLALARLLLQKRPVVVLDEPTASLDIGTGSYVLCALRELFVTQTVVVITHHQVNEQWADFVLDMDNPGGPKVTPVQDYLGGSGVLAHVPVMP